MKKWVYVVTFILLVSAAFPLTGCSSRAISGEVAQSLVEMSKGRVESIDSEIANTDQELHSAQEHLLKLQQVLDAALAWVDFQKTIQRPGKWDIKVTPDGLAQLKNDQFQVTELSCVIVRDSIQVTESSYTIKMQDFTTMEIDDGIALQSKLTYGVNQLQQNREVMSAARDLSIFTVNNVLKYVSDWQVKKINGKTYDVSGAGLGWTDQLTAGVWKFDQENGTLLPEDAPATALNDIVLAKLASQ